MNNPKICTPCLFTTNDFFFLPSFGIVRVCQIQVFGHALLVAFFPPITDAREA